MTDTAPPEPIRRVIAFVNTVDVEAHTDAIATPADFAAWLQEQQLLAEGETITATDVAAAVRLREALRSALLAHDDHGSTAHPDTALTTVALQLTIRGDGSIVLMGDDAGTPALGRLVAPIPGAIGDGSWSRTKVCPMDTCLWAFYDHSRNRSRRWCRMEICGNREKTRTFRERQRAD